MKRWLALLFVPLLLAFSEVPLEDPRAEARALSLMDEIRCVACENEPISQSGSDIAADMRARVREMVGSGASNAEVRGWFEERYGEFVLFRPSTHGLSGMVLWGLPFLLLLAGAGILILAGRKRAAAAMIRPVRADAYDHGNATEDEL